MGQDIRQDGLSANTAQTICQSVFLLDNASRLLPHSSPTLPPRSTTAEVWQYIHLPLAAIPQQLEIAVVLNLR